MKTIEKFLLFILRFAQFGLDRITDLIEKKRLYRYVLETEQLLKEKFGYESTHCRIEAKKGRPDYKVYLACINGHFDIRFICFWSARALAMEKRWSSRLLLECAYNYEFVPNPVQKEAVVAEGVGFKGYE